MSAIKPGGGTSGGAVAAADITDSTSVGRSVLTGTAAQGRTALSVPPTSRIVGGLDLSADRSASDLMTSLGASSYASGLDSARPAASGAIIGRIYVATDSGYAYQCVSSTTWRRLGAGGLIDGFDTTAVQLGGSVGARAFGPTIPAASSVSFACYFSRITIATGTSIIATLGCHQFEIGGNAGDRDELTTYVSGTGTARVATGTISGSPTAINGFAATVSGFTTSFSLNGGAVQTASHSSGSANTSLGAMALSSGGYPFSGHVLGVKTWSTVMSNADLVSLSGAAATGRFPAVTGTDTLEWRAGWFPAALLTQQLSGSIGGLLTWTNGYPLSVR